MLSCHPLDYVIVEGLRRHSGVNNFRHLLIIPNFKGSECFPDQYFKSNFFYASHGRN